MTHDLLLKIIDRDLGWHLLGGAIGMGRDPVFEGRFGAATPTKHHPRQAGAERAAQQRPPENDVEGGHAAGC